MMFHSLVKLGQPLITPTPGSYPSRIIPNLLPVVDRTFHTSPPLSNTPSPSAQPSPSSPTKSSSSLSLSLSSLSSSYSTDPIYALPPVDFVHRESRRRFPSKLPYRPFPTVGRRNHRKDLYEVAALQPHFGRGLRFQRYVWKRAGLHDCFWTVSQIHAGKAWGEKAVDKLGEPHFRRVIGRLTWKGVEDPRLSRVSHSETKGWFCLRDDKHIVQHGENGQVKIKPIRLKGLSDAYKDLIKDFGYAS